MTMFFCYCVYIFSFILQYVLLSLLCQLPSKYLILYPFTYDGTFSFVPLKLLYHGDLINSNFYLTLVNDLGGKFKEKFYKIYLIKNLTTLLAIIIVSLLVYQKIDLIVVGFIFCIFILLISVSFSKFNNYSGASYLIVYNEIDKYYYMSKVIQSITTKQYQNYLKDNYQTLTNLELMEISENYLFRVVYDNEHIDLNLMSKIIDYYSFKYQLSADLKFNNVIKLIGRIGIINNNIKEVNFSIKNILMLNNKFTGLNLKRSIEFNNEYIAYLKGNETLNLSHHLLVDVKTIFVSISKIEAKILFDA